MTETDACVRGRACMLIIGYRGEFRAVDSGRGAARAEDAQGTPTQSHISPSILEYEDKSTAWTTVGCQARACTSTRLRIPTSASSLLLATHKVLEPRVEVLEPRVE